MKRSCFVVLFIIFLLGGILRIVHLESLPNGLNRDEAALGYNAYLLKSTGKDEWGTSWPLTLKSFGDYKLIGASLVMIPFIQLLGMTDLAVRLPIALAGLALIPLSFVLSKKLRLSPGSSLVVASLVAFSPIFFFFSRYGFEAILALSYVLGALVCWLTAGSKSKRLLLDIGGMVLFVLAGITYNTPLLLLPVTLLFIVSDRGILRPTRWLWLSISLILVGFILGYLLHSATQAKQAITIFSDPTIAAAYPEYRSQFSGMSQQALGNTYVYYAKEISTRFFSFFTPNFLVLKGGTHPWHQLPGFAHLVWPTYVLILIALLWVIFNLATHWRDLIQSRYYQKSLFSSPPHRQFVLVLTLLYALLIPSITSDAPHATRSLFAFIMLFLLMGTALDQILNSLKKSNQKRWFLMGAGICCVFFIIGSSQYYVQYFRNYAEISRQIVHSGLVGYVVSNHVSQPVVVDPEGYQYIQVAWDIRLPAAEFFQTMERSQPDTIGFSRGRAVANFRFVQQDSDAQTGETILYWKDDQWHIQK